MKVKVVVFDLDDTLYNEIEFVYSGFNAVSKYFSNKYNINKVEFFDNMVEILNKFGRGQVFDLVLKKFYIYNKINLKKSISIYRLHSPKINLPDESIETLKYIKNNNIPIYIVTDGNKIVQSKKIEALKVEKYVNKVYITHRYGLKYSKPSTYCFKKILELEKCSYNEVVYIGDNVNKDFINIKKLGFRTIRIINGMFKNVIKKEEYHAEIDINNILDVKNILKLKHNIKEKEWKK